MRPLRLFPASVLAFASLLATAQSPSEPEPGVHLSGMVTLVQHPETGDAIASSMHAAPLSTNLHTGSNIAKGLVYANQQHSVETAGPTAATAISTTSPTFYIRLDPEDPNNIPDEVTLVRLKPTQDTRIVITFTANAFGGSRKRHVDAVPVTKAKLNSSVLKVTPASPLPPGEYGIVILPPDQATYADRVYDFSVAAK